MKKIISTAFILSLAIATSYAQELYLRLGLGFAFPMSGQSVYDTPIPYYDFPSAYNGTRNYNASGSQTYNIKNNASFSSGFNAIIGLGYMFNDNIGVQLDAGLGLASKEYSFTDENLPLNVGGGSTIPYNITTNQKADEPIFMMPQLVLQTSGDKVKVYSRIGLVLPLDTKITQDQIFTNGAGTGALTTDDFTWQIQNSFSLGFTAAAGVKYKISDKVSIWGEVSVVSLSVYTKEQDLKSWNETDPTYGSQSIPLSNYNGAQTIKFSKTATVDSTYSQFPPYAQPFSNMAINVGVTFTLSKHEKRSRRNNDDIDGGSKPFRRR